MPLDGAKAKKLLTAFEFKLLFIEELGWNRYDGQMEALVDGQTFTLSAIAEKRGMAAFVCDPGSNGLIPGYPARRKIERQVAKSTHEHLIIFTDGKRTAQVWQWVRREQGRPAACREHIYHAGQPGDSLIQKLQALAVSLEEEESLTLPDVTGRVKRAFDIERVTKRFYDRFQTEHAAFLKFLEGIPNEELERWYASVMLNRLMFIYFIQKKGFLNNDRDYLKSRLTQCRRDLGKDRYYRDFLCPLFFEGFAKRLEDRSDKTRRLLGEVPYLNGGIFMPHQIEQIHGKAITIPDKAFEKLFEFFGAYQWHLDERPLRRDDEINPDVLGYIFEKYINQKQMGAYYTKEDITEYISKNTVIPFLFDAARAKCKLAFEGEQSVWQLLRDDPDRYIYPAVKHGVDLPLPPEIAAGVGDVSQRAGWNKPAPSEYALPTEIWREVVARRKRYEEVRGKFVAGEARSVNDLITHNLDIRQFAQDVVEDCEGPELLVAFWKAIESVTVLDPACGSGAFLFAALNILDPLYEACLERMRFFLEEWGVRAKKNHPNYYKLFTKTLKRVEDHPNHRYFVLKCIIVNNLFGVDIMDEAVEICKLRLFLKLVAQIERVEDIEPLPDVDFNIRAGNTLVGFALLDEVRKTLERLPLGFPEHKQDIARIEEEAEIADRAFRKFREMQTEQSMSPRDFTEAKENLRARLEKLTNELDRFLASEYGVDAKKKDDFEEWRKSHQPLHWFAEFYGIMKHGGFDVIIGNPPYVSTSEARKDYTVLGYRTQVCPDIYAWFLERTGALLTGNGYTGMIVPLSLGFSGRFEVCRQDMFSKYQSCWFSSFGRIPSALFSFDVRVRNTIYLAQRATSLGTHRRLTTRLHRWFEAERPHLFQMLSYSPFEPSLWQNRIPKLHLPSIAATFEGLLANKVSVHSALAPSPTRHSLSFKKTAYNWLCFCIDLPPCYDERGKSIEHTKFGTVYFQDQRTRDIAFMLLNGKLMFIFWSAVGDDFDLTQWMFGDLPINLNSLAQSVPDEFFKNAELLQDAMQSNINFKLNAGRRVGNYNLAKCRGVTDLVDRQIARLLGFADVWPELELAYSQMVKTSFDGEEGEEEEEE